MEAKQDVSWSGVRAYDGSLNLDGSDCSGNADDVLGAAWSFAASRQHIVEPLHCLHELIENEMGARLLMRSGLSLKNMHSLKALVAEELDLLKDNGVNDTSCTGVYIAYLKQCKKSADEQHAQHGLVSTEHLLMGLFRSAMASGKSKDGKHWEPGGLAVSATCPDGQWTVSKVMIQQLRAEEMINERFERKLIRGEICSHKMLTLGADNTRYSLKGKPKKAEAGERPASSPTTPPRAPEGQRQPGSGSGRAARGEGEPGAPGAQRGVRFDDNNNNNNAGVRGSSSDNDSDVDSDDFVNIRTDSEGSPVGGVAYT